MTDDWDEDFGPDDFYFDCGLAPDGICLLAGTEDCDWDCPHRDRSFLKGAVND
jgi:hypothetical protein